MPLFEVYGKVVRTGRLVVEADNLAEAEEQFKEQMTGGTADGLRLFEEAEAEVDITEGGEVDDVYMEVTP